MTGINNGVHKVLKEEYGLRDLVLIRCVCHSLQLALPPDSAGRPHLLLDVHVAEGSIVLYIYSTASSSGDIHLILLDVHLVKSCTSTPKLPLGTASM
ncbi:hypothetical protein DPEC_G00038360 [Dallia pectoralis]|uniref:Uncharacterized protein n=1 Tax=Dallia pectoralis TaxID=75939 RepID=A0ACC2HE76_DALPE|nr:hypothetical protein DPEC_G00038360 [Dallia pectoralis]